MDPRKAAAQWLQGTVFREEAIRPRAPRPAERVPQVIRAARSLENGACRGWQSREILFVKQGKLLAGYEDDYDCTDVDPYYYPTYQTLSDAQLRGYFSWRTKLRRGDVRKAPLTFAFLYMYEQINQIGVADAMDGFRKLEAFRDAYGPINGAVLPYLERWLEDYVIYYGLDPGLLSGSPQMILDGSVTVLDHIEEQDDAEVAQAVRSLSTGWLGRSRFYAANREDMDAVTVRVLRRISAHYAARCRRTMADQYFGGFSRRPVSPFDSAVFCDPLKRRNYRYAVSSQRVYRCEDGLWSVWKRALPPGSGGRLDALLKTIDSVMREEYGDRHPVKAGVDTKWVVKLIREEAQGLLAEKQAAEEKKITIDYTQLTQIRRDAAVTQEKLAVEEELDLPEEPVPPEQELPRPAAPEAPEPDPGSGPPLSPPEYRLLQCLLYGGDTGWVQAEGHLLSVLADGINEKLYDEFLDCVLDGEGRLVDDYIDELKGMVHP